MYTACIFQYEGNWCHVFLDLVETIWSNLPLVYHYLTTINMVFGHFA